MEVWKEINNYPSYFVSNFGNIKRNEKLLKGGLRGNKNKLYKGVSLRNNGIQKSFFIHRLVGETFLEKNGYNEIDHIDGNKLNNNISNLRWVSSQINNRNRRKMATYNGVKTASKYKGITWNKNANHWGARVYINKMAIYLGSSKNEDDAGRLYNKYITDNQLEGYKLNEILSGNPITY